MKNIKRIKFLSVVLFFIWTISLMVSLFYTLITIDKKHDNLALEHAKNAFEKDLMFRRWVAMHGGVYVFPTEKTPPNPYLAHIPNRDLTATTGEKLTLMNPAYTLRELMENFKGMYGEKGHITSLNLLNPKNKADEWETKVLKQFEKKETTEFHEFYNYQGSEHLRYMRALETKPNCLKCHAEQGYKVGDIRGGVSITIPMEKYNNDGEIEKQNVIYFHLFILLLGIAIGYYIYQKVLVIVTKEDDLEAKLQSEKDRIETIVESNNNAIIALDSEGVITTYNKKAEEIFGWSKEEMLGTKSLTKIIPPAYKEEHLKALEHYYKAGKLSGKFDNAHQAEAINKNGEIFPIKISLGSKVEDGNRTVIANISDISKEIEQQKLIIQQSKMVSMGEMIGNIAHQWRQPLSVISTGASGMKMQKEYNTLSDKDFFATCDAINENAQYLSKTIDDFRDFIKGERKKVSFKLSKNFESFLNLVEGSIKSNQIIIHNNIPEDITLEGYANELLQCYINIFNNAKDAFKNKDGEKHLFVSASLDDSKVIIRIKDNAGGIPLEVLPKIFEPYFTTKHQYHGTGLGLSMTYNFIVNGMNGTIEARNAEYKYSDQNFIGAEFIITLPIK